MTKLIHGDIHGGNLLLKAKKLVLIDWDEAAREKPFRRIALNDTEKCQYPSALISFPELYTKQQLLELFHYLLREYYPATKGENSWNQYQAKERIPESERLTITVGARYKTLCDFLSSELSLQETE
jgi:thiamine kinase-like enzyme